MITDKDMQNIKRLLDAEKLEVEIDMLIRAFNNKSDCVTSSKAQVKAVEYNKKHNLPISSKIGFLMALNEL